jgi:hypothetical protein
MDNKNQKSLAEWPSNLDINQEPSPTNLTLQIPMKPEIQIPAMPNQDSEKEVIKLKIRLFQFCLWFSLTILCVLLVLIVLTRVFPGAHPPDDPYDRYMTLFGRIQFIVAFLLIPSLYGTFAWIPMRHLKMGKTVRSKFFIGIIAVGIVSACIGYLGSGLGHLDCGNGCGSDVPSYQLMDVAFLIALAVTTIGPIIAIVRLGKLNGIPKIIQKVVKNSVTTIVLLTIVIASLIGWNKYQNAHQPLYCNGVTVKSYQDKACKLNN